MEPPNPGPGSSKLTSDTSRASGLAWLHWFSVKSYSVIAYTAAMVDVALAAISITFGSLTVIGSLLVVLSYVLFSECRTLSRKLVTILSICDLGQGLFFAIPVNESGSLCDMMGLWGIFVAVASFGWTCAIALFVNQTLKYPEVDFGYLVKWFHVVCFGYPLLFCIVLGAADLGVMQPGDTPGGGSSSVPWCFIGQDHLWWRMTAIYIPLFLSWILTFTFYWVAQRRINQMASKYRIGQQSGRSRAGFSEVKSKLILIPLIFVLLRVWGALLRIIEAVDSRTADSMYWLKLMTAMGDSSQGLASCVIFVFFTDKVRSRYVDLLCYPCRRWRDSGEHMKLIDSRAGGTGTGAGTGADRHSSYDGLASSDDTHEGITGGRPGFADTGDLYGSGASGGSGGTTSGSGSGGTAQRGALSGASSSSTVASQPAAGGAGSGAGAGAAAAAAVVAASRVSRGEVERESDSLDGRRGAGDADSGDDSDDPELGRGGSRASNASAAGSRSKGGSASRTASASASNSKKSRKAHLQGGQLEGGGDAVWTSASSGSGEGSRKGGAGGGGGGGGVDAGNMSLPRVRDTRLLGDSGSGSGSGSGTASGSASHSRQSSQASSIDSDASSAQGELPAVTGRHLHVARAERAAERAAAAGKR